jgi:hypothetical protein
MKPKVYQPGRHKDLPKIILGLKCAQHRVTKIHEILDFYHWQYSKKSSTKIKLLSMLVTFSQDLPQQEQDALRIWLAQDEGHVKLADIVTAARGPTIRELYGEASNTSRKLVKRPKKVPKKKKKTINRECIACMEAFTIDSLPAIHLTPDCVHEPDTCSSCLTQSLDIQIRDQPWDQITCPSCPQRLPYEIVKLLASPAAFQM